MEFTQFFEQVSMKCDKCGTVFRDLELLAMEEHMKNCDGRIVYCKVEVAPRISLNSEKKAATPLKNSKKARNQKSIHNKKNSYRFQSYLSSEPKQSASETNSSDSSSQNKSIQSKSHQHKTVIRISSSSSEIETKTRKPDRKANKKQKFRKPVQSISEPDVIIVSSSTSSEDSKTSLLSSKYNLSSSSSSPPLTPTKSIRTGGGKSNFQFSPETRRNIRILSSPGPPKKPSSKRKKKRNRYRQVVTGRIVEVPNSPEVVEAGNVLNIHILGFSSENQNSVRNFNVSFWDDDALFPPEPIIRLQRSRKKKGAIISITNCKLSDKKMKGLTTFIVTKTSRITENVADPNIRKLRSFMESMNLSPTTRNPPKKMKKKVKSEKKMIRAKSEKKPPIPNAASSVRSTNTTTKKQSSQYISKKQFLGSKYSSASDPVSTFRKKYSDSSIDTMRYFGHTISTYFNDEQIPLITTFQKIGIGPRMHIDFAEFYRDFIKNIPAKDKVIQNMRIYRVPVLGGVYVVQTPEEKMILDAKGNKIKYENPHHKLSILFDFPTVSTQSTRHLEVDGEKFCRRTYKYEDCPNFEVVVISNVELVAKKYITKSSSFVFVHFSVKDTKDWKSCRVKYSKDSHKTNPFKLFEWIRKRQIYGDGRGGTEKALRKLMLDTVVKGAKDNNFSHSSFNRKLKLLEKSDDGDLAVFMKMKDNPADGIPFIQSVVSTHSTDPSYEVFASMKSSWVIFNALSEHFPGSLKVSHFDETFEKFGHYLTIWLLKIPIFEPPLYILGNIMASKKRDEEFYKIFMENWKRVNELTQLPHIVLKDSDSASKLGFEYMNDFVKLARSKGDISLHEMKLINCLWHVEKNIGDHAKFTLGLSISHLRRGTMKSQFYKWLYVDSVDQYDRNCSSYESFLDKLDSKGRMKSYFIKNKKRMLRERIVDFNRLCETFDVKREEIVQHNHALESYNNVVKEEYKRCRTLPELFSSLKERLIVKKHRAIFDTLLGVGGSRPLKFSKRVEEIFKVDEKNEIRARLLKEYLKIDLADEQRNFVSRHLKNLPELASKLGWNRVFLPSPTQILDYNSDPSSFEIKELLTPIEDLKKSLYREFDESKCRNYILFLLNNPRLYHLESKSQCRIYSRRYKKYLTCEISATSNKCESCDDSICRHRLFLCQNNTTALSYLNNHLNYPFRVPSNIFKNSKKLRGSKQKNTIRNTNPHSLRVRTVNEKFYYHGVLLFRCVVSKKIVPLERLEEYKQDDLKRLCQTDKEKFRGFSNLKTDELREHVKNVLISDASTCVFCSDGKYGGVCNSTDCMMKRDIMEVKGCELTKTQVLNVFCAISPDIPSEIINDLRNLPNITPAQKMNYRMFQEYWRKLIMNVNAELGSIIVLKVHEDLSWKILEKSDRLKLIEFEETVLERMCQRENILVPREEVVGDGNCFWRSLERYLWIVYSIQMSHLDIRKNASDWLLTNYTNKLTFDGMEVDNLSKMDNGIPYIRLSDAYTRDILEEEVEEIVKPTRYARSLAVRCAATVLEAKIIVFRVTTSNSSIFGSEGHKTVIQPYRVVGGNAGAITNEIKVVFLSARQHYNIVVEERDLDGDIKAILGACYGLNECRGVKRISPSTSKCDEDESEGKRRKLSSETEEFRSPISNSENTRSILISSESLEEADEEDELESDVDVPEPDLDWEEADRDVDLGSNKEGGEIEMDEDVQSDSEIAKSTPIPPPLISTDSTVSPPVQHVQSEEVSSNIPRNSVPTPPQLSRVVPCCFNMDKGTNHPAFEGEDRISTCTQMKQVDIMAGKVKGVCGLKITSLEGTGKCRDCNMIFVEGSCGHRVVNESDKAELQVCYKCLSSKKCSGCGMGDLIMSNEIANGGDTGLVAGICTYCYSLLHSMCLVPDPDRIKLKQPNLGPYCNKCAVRYGWPKLEDVKYATFQNEN